MSEPLHVGLIGSKFMGRAHSNAWLSVNRFFDLPRQAGMHTVCARDADATAAFARTWGWERTTTDWKSVVADPAIGLVDVATPNHVHADPSIAALEAGKHVACEKPLAGTLSDARTMRDAARQAAVRGVKTFVWFNYRRCPAVAYAHQLVRQGRLGQIYHVRAQYLQDWGGPETPLLWRFDASQAGSGAHGDLNAHIIDMARFITGDEFASIHGAIEETFIEERTPVGGGPPGPSTVDDCVLFLARFKGGAVGSFESTRLATGNQNRNAIEINGSKGSLRFDFERMNELVWWDNTLEPGLRGWSRIMCTSAGHHPYVDAYWPDAHLLGYEHGFVSMAADVIRAVAGEQPVVPLPDFDDAYETQRVLEAALLAAREQRTVAMDEVIWMIWMVISAVLFGYLGFGMGMTAANTSGQTVPFFALLLWTLRGSAVAFGLSAVVTLVKPRAGHLLYAVTGLVGAALFVVVLVMDLLDDQNMAAVPPLFLGAFAAWNGFGSWQSLRDLLAGAPGDGSGGDADR